jgi:hypothetical protein
MPAADTEIARRELLRRRDRGDGQRHQRDKNYEDEGPRGAHAPIVRPMTPRSSSESEFHVKPLALATEAETQGRSAPARSEDQGHTRRLCSQQETA